MKNLIFKEFKLSMHPLIYVFVLAFPLMVLIPSYPMFVSFIYLCSTYPILFLGTKKGVQSNDLVYTTLLPVRKKDIVLARLITIVFMQLAFFLITLALSPIKLNMIEKMMTQPNNTYVRGCVGLEPDAIFSIIGFALISYSVFDIIFLPLFYRNGKAVLLGTILGICAFSIVFAALSLILPITNKAFSEFCSGFDHLGNQFLILGGGLVIYIAIHFLIYKISAKLLNKVNY